jgi:hypothetical protein
MDLILIIVCLQTVLRMADADHRKADFTCPRDLTRRQAALKSVPSSLSSSRPNLPSKYSTVIVVIIRP